MKVGIYFDLRNPAGWQRSWSDHYASSLDRVVEAERLGADSVWFSEHHLFDDGYLPQPLTFAAAVAARTERVRIGTAVLLAALRHPRHIAEQAAVVDLISAGRLDLGMGAGYSAVEFAAFGVDIARRYELVDAAVVEVRELLRDPACSPPPVQEPLPLWLGYQGPRGARRAGRLGVGLLSVDRALEAPYLEGLAEGGSGVEPRMAGLIDIIVADDPEATRDELLPFYAHQLNTYRRASVAGTGAPEPREVTVERLREGIRKAGNAPGLNVLSPTEAVDAVRERVDGLPVEHVYFWASVAGMPDELAARHMELLLGEVRPHLAG